MNPVDGGPPPPPALRTVKVSVLIHRLVENSYSDLMKLSRTVKDQPDQHRKVAFRDFFKQLRHKFLRLLVLVKWAAQMPHIEKFNEIKAILSARDMSFRDTADGLYLVRQDLLKAREPNYDIPVALDVLANGTYSDLPECVTELAPTLPEQDSVETTLTKLNEVISIRLLSVRIPSDLKLRIDAGMAHCFIPNKFCVSLTLEGDMVEVPWRVLSAEVYIAGSSDPHTTAKVLADAGCEPPMPWANQLPHEQMIGLVWLLQRRMGAAEHPLAELHAVMHTFCMELQLDILRGQAAQIAQDREGTTISTSPTPSSRQVIELKYWPHLQRKTCAPPPSLRIVPLKSGEVRLAHSPEVTDPYTNVPADFTLHPTALSLEAALQHAQRCHAFSRLLKLQGAALEYINTSEQFLGAGESSASRVELVAGSPSGVPSRLRLRVFQRYWLSVLVDLHTGDFILDASRVADPVVLDEMETALNACPDADTLPWFKSVFSTFQMHLSLQQLVRLSSLSSLRLEPFEKLPISGALREELAGPYALFLQFKDTPQYYLLADVQLDSQPLFFLLRLNDGAKRSKMSPSVSGRERGGAGEANNVHGGFWAVDRVYPFEPNSVDAIVAEVQSAEMMDESGHFHESVSAVKPVTIEQVGGAAGSNNGRSQSTNRVACKRRRRRDPTHGTLGEAGRGRKRKAEDDGEEDIFEETTANAEENGQLGCGLDEDPATQHMGDGPPSSGTDVRWGGIEAAAVGDEGVSHGVLLALVLWSRRAIDCIILESVLRRGELTERHGLPHSFSFRLPSHMLSSSMSPRPSLHLRDISVEFHGSHRWVALVQPSPDAIPGLGEEELGFEVLDNAFATISSGERHIRYSPRERKWRFSYSRLSEHYFKKLLSDLRRVNDVMGWARDAFALLGRCGRPADEAAEVEGGHLGQVQLREVIPTGLVLMVRGECPLYIIRTRQPDHGTVVHTFGPLLPLSRHLGYALNYGKSRSVRHLIEAVVKAYDCMKDLDDFLTSVARTHGSQSLFTMVCKSTSWVRLFYRGRFAVDIRCIGHRMVHVTDAHAALFPSTALGAGVAESGASGGNSRAGVVGTSLEPIPCFAEFWREQERQADGFTAAAAAVASTPSRGTSAVVVPPSISAAIQGVVRPPRANLLCGECFPPPAAILTS